MGHKGRRGPGATPHAGENLESLSVRESTGRAGPGSAWLDILGAGAASAKAEETQNQGLAGPQTLSGGGEPTLPPHTEVRAGPGELEEKLEHGDGEGTGRLNSSTTCSRSAPAWSPEAASAATELRTVLSPWRLSF